MSKLKSDRDVAKGRIPAIAALRQSCLYRDVPSDLKEDTTGRIR
jgi:hypothetical protein